MQFVCHGRIVPEVASYGVALLLHNPPTPFRPEKGSSQQKVAIR